MEFEHIVATMNCCGCEFLLIGGFNFSLRHRPYTTLDVDFWIKDTKENRDCCELALVALDAEWGATEDEWGHVKRIPAGWLAAQHVFSLLTPHGPVDIFRSVAGLGTWEESAARAYDGNCKDGTAYRGLSDEDMLRSQLALSEGERKFDRIRVLENALRQSEQQS